MCLLSGPGLLTGRGGSPLLRRRLAQIITGTVASVHPHEHLHQFTSETLRAFLLKTGFEFISEHTASPYVTQGTVLNYTKRLCKLAASTLFKLTGINVAGILMFGRKAKSDMTI